MPKDQPDLLDEVGPEEKAQPLFDPRRVQGRVGVAHGVHRVLHPLPVLRAGDEEEQVVEVLSRWGWGRWVLDCGRFVRG